MFSRSVQVFAAAAVTLVLLTLIQPTQQARQPCKVDKDCGIDSEHCASEVCVCNSGYHEVEVEILPGVKAPVCKPGLSGGAIAGIVIGVLIIVVAAGVGVMYMRRQRMACFA